MAGLRIGFGYDIHRLAPGRRLVLGGVTIAHPQGLLGHSDADVVCHALADAVLGALGDGDIGGHFPPSDPRWKDVDSLKLLRLVADRMVNAGASVVNADVTVVAEAPRLAPHVPRMRELLAASLGTGADRISVKATTNEGVGPEGRAEAISATAVCLLRVELD